MATEEKLDLCVYIGRFSIFHNGHAEVLLRALRKYKEVLVIVGSAKQPRTIKNPWTAEERADLIEEWYSSEFEFNPDLGQLRIRASRDYPYNDDLWLIETQKIISACTTATSLSKNKEVIPYITGSKRDDTGFYLDMFPRPLYELDLVEENRDVSKYLTATWCRDLYLGRHAFGKEVNQAEYDFLIRAVVPPTTFKFLKDFEGTDAFKYLRNEYTVTTVRREEAQTKYGPRIDVTVDNVVIQSGHVLLVRRKSAPGKGLWALPGGYLNAGEWTINGAIRELKEESKIDWPETVIKRSLVFDQWFEHPGRSNITRVITHAFCFKLPAKKVAGRVTLAGVEGSDDAEKAQWFTLADALNMGDQLFDDHLSILEAFFNRLEKK